jgi:hypothetical protein
MQELRKDIESAEHTTSGDSTVVHISEHVVRAYMSTEGGNYAAAVDAVRHYPQPLGLLICVALSVWAEHLKPSLTASPFVLDSVDKSEAYLDALFLLSRQDIVLNAISSLRAINAAYLGSDHDAELKASANMIRALCASPAGQWWRVLRVTSKMMSKTNEALAQNVDSIGVNPNLDDAEGLNRLIVSTYSRFPEDERVREVGKLIFPFFNDAIQIFSVLLPVY